MCSLSSKTKTIGRLFERSEQKANSSAWEEWNFWRFIENLNFRTWKVILEFEDARPFEKKNKQIHFTGKLMEQLTKLNLESWSNSLFTEQCAFTHD